jgi:peptidoglycan/LPS O-acetylase OafA/YrhL
MYVGFTRLLYPFLCGLLISRILPGRMTKDNPSGSPIRIRGGFWWCALVLAGILAMPCIGGKSGVPDGLFQAASILVLFPLIVLTGAGSQTTDAFSTRFCKFLGDVSFPLYITHYPLIYAQMSFAVKYADAPLWQHVLVAVGVFFFSVGMAYALFKAFDEPTRKWLTEHWLKRRRG